jgi:hypothetical protein
MFSGLMSRWTVRVAERVGDLARDPDGLSHGELLAAQEEIPQRFSFNERHDVVQQLAAGARVVHGENARMLQTRRNADLALETLRTQGGAQLRAEHLDRDGPLVPEVPGKEDSRHPATPDLALDIVATRQGSAQQRQGVARRRNHEGPAWSIAEVTSGHSGMEAKRPAGSPAEGLAVGTIESTAPDALPAGRAMTNRTPCSGTGPRRTLATP